jgi:hypothetical protein
MMARIVRGIALALLALGLTGIAGPVARAGEVDVVAAEVSCDAQRVCHFVVTLRHADEGWKHYANRWEVISPDGEVLGTRVLRHPHVEEQPFTRSLPGVEIPEASGELRIRAHDSVHGYGGKETLVTVPR